MKMVKSLLLGSAAGLFAVAGAQAADLPVKAKAVEYVKVCSAYGAGYYYIPGTDTCIKIGGYVRFDTYVNAVGTFRPDIATSSSAGFNGPGAGNYAFPFRDQDDADYMTRVRTVIDADARTQTEYGTLRSYLRFGAEWNTQSGAGAGTGNGLYIDRAFIQFAGFTFGYTQSFFDTGTQYSYTQLFAGSNTLTTTLAYTAQFGNGFSATIALEDAAYRTTGVQATGANFGSNLDWGAGGLWPSVINTSGAGLSYTNYQAGQEVPDIVANLRLDQAWGTLQLSGALHQVKALTPLYQGAAFLGADSSDTWGWGIGGSAEFKLPFLAPGDSFYVQANYSDGAIAYAGTSGNNQGLATAWGNVKIDSNGFLSGAFYPLADAMATDPWGDFDTVKAWAIQAQFRHFWTPALRSAIFGGYVDIDVPENNIVGAEDVNMWQIGANTIWSPVKNLDIGAEVTYSKVEGDGPLRAVNAVNAAGAYNAASTTLVGGSTDVFSGGVRVQRNF